MQAQIHPVYHVEAKVVCNCGNTFNTGSVKEEIRVEICSACHPVYTGVKRYVDTLGRVDKFILAQNAAAQKQAAIQSKKKSKGDDTKAQSAAPRTIKEMLQMLDTDSSSQA
jgi:large subunit ribosomal protein L31